MKNSFFVNFIFFITVLISTFLFCSKSVFGADITSAPLDPNYAQWLKDNMFGNGTSSSGSVPSGSAIINGYAPQLSPFLLDQINQNLYDTYGYDLDDAYSDIAMSVLDYDETSSERVQLLQTLTGGLYDNFSAITSAGLTLGKVAFDNTYGNIADFFDTYVVGSFDEVSGNITQTFDNAIYKIKDDWTTFWEEFSNNFIYNGSALNGCVISDKFTYDFTTSTGLLMHHDFNFDSTVCLFANIRPSDNYGYELYALSSSSSISGSGVLVFRGNGYTINRISFHQVYETVINGNTWYYGPIVYFAQGLPGYVAYVNDSFGSLDVASNIYTNNSTPSINYDIYVDGGAEYVKSLLEGLNGKYITKDELDQLLSIIGNTDISIYSDNDSVSTVAELDPTLVAELEGLIDSINELSLTLAGEIDVISPVPDPDPDPDPDPEPDPSPSPLPSGYFPTIFPNLVPDEMFEMFQPVFDIVGVDNSMYDVWLLIPAILIATLILYLIVSLF